MFSTVFLVLVFGSVLSDCKTSGGGTGNIVGGSFVNKNEFYPYMVSLQYKAQHFCGGSIVSPRYILTAAHCLIDFTSFEGVTVEVGTNVISHGMSYNIESSLIHPYYSTVTNEYDLALGKTEAPIKMSMRVKPVALHTAMVGPRTRVLLTGWGLTEADGPGTSMLKKISFNTISNQKCGNDRDEDIPPHELCTTTVWDNGFCDGDSGSPLVLPKSLAQVGIVSRSVPGCAEATPEVYTRVSTFIPWIASSIRNI